MPTDDYFRHDCCLFKRGKKEKEEEEEKKQHKHIDTESATQTYGNDLHFNNRLRFAVDANVKRSQLLENHHHN